jgi:two-component system response regulator QseB
MRLLLVEDDPILGDGMAASLRLRGWAVDWSRTAAQADLAISGVAYDVVILDLGLPDGEGLKLLRSWRERRMTLPVLVLTARDGVDSRIGGLDAGADDYLIKPLSMDELAARLRALLRRSSGRLETVWRHGLLSFDPRSRRVTWHGRAVELTAFETALLELLLTHPTRVFSKAQIQDKLYDWSRQSESNTVEVFVHHLRRKIAPTVVRTVRGLGYSLGAAK